MFYSIVPLTVIKITLPSTGLISDVCDQIHSLYAMLLCEELVEMPKKIHGRQAHIDNDTLRDVCGGILLHAIEYHVPDLDAIVLSAYDGIRQQCNLLQIRSSGDDIIGVVDIKIVRDHVSFTLQLRTHACGWGRTFAVRTGIKDYDVVIGCFGRNPDKLHIIQ